MTSTQWFGFSRPITQTSGDGVGLEALLEQLGVGERVAGVGVDRAQGGLAGRHVVGVAGADALPVPLGALDEDDVRA